MKLNCSLKNHLLAQIMQIRSKYVEGIRRSGKALLGVALNLAFLLIITALPSVAQQMPNPFGGGGTTKLANAGANIMVIGTWLAFFVGLLSFVLIPIFIKFEWNYKKLLISGFTGLGGFIVIGSIAYDIVNLNSINMSDPTLGG